MNFGWETEKEKLLKYMKISPRQKLEWLEQVNVFINKCSTKSTKSIKQKLKKRFMEKDFFE